MFECELTILMGVIFVYKSNHLSVNQWMGIILLLSILVINVVLLELQPFLEKQQIMIIKLIRIP
jgi:hypothetical protein